MQLKQFAALQVGLPLKRRENPNGVKFRLLSAKHINTYGEITGSEVFEAQPGIATNFFTLPGDVIMKLAAPNQALCITREEDCDLLVSSYFSIIRCQQPDLCLPEYLAAYLNSQAFAQILERERTCSTVKSLKLSALQEVDVPILKLERQREIVQFVQLANQEQKQLQALLTAKQQYHQSILLKQFGGDHG